LHQQRANYPTLALDDVAAGIGASGLCSSCGTVPGLVPLEPHLDERLRNLSHPRGLAPQGDGLMAIKATIYKASLQIADMDRGVYADHGLTLALHPSETEERLMMRLLAFVLQAPADNDDGALLFARGLADSDEPDLWQHDLTGQLMHWMEVGLPDDRRLSKACGRARRVTLYTYAGSTAVWWAAIENKLVRLSNLAVWQVPAEQSQALTGLAQRSMQLQFTIQDGQIWVSDGQTSVEIQPQCLKAAKP
jgi:uncharacterized protein YaeQ